MLFAISEVKNVEETRGFLNRDPAFASYVLGDLEPPYRKDTTCFAASQTGEIEGLALIYRGIDPPLLFLMGSAAALSALLLNDIAPDTVEFNIKPDFLETFSTFYELEYHYQAMRMMLKAADYNAESLPRPDKIVVRKLKVEDSRSVEQVMEKASASDKRDIRDVAFSADMLKSGYYFGGFDGKQLVAVAGTHLTVKSVKLAAIGNVAVLEDYRAKGFGRLVSTHVLEALIADGYQDIVLNVQIGNEPAEKIYNRLGFKAQGEFVQGIATQTQ